MKILDLEQAIERSLTDYESFTRVGRERDYNRPDLSSPECIAVERDFIVRLKRN